jgi:proteic killer suppression protein
MIRSFKDQGLEKCWREGRCNKVPAKLQHRVLMKLDSMDAATCVEDLRNPPGNHLHTLQGKDFAGCWAISIMASNYSSITEVMNDEYYRT